jgi:hypothetical protein
MRLALLACLLIFTLAIPLGNAMIVNEAPSADEGPFKYQATPVPVNLAHALYISPPVYVAQKVGEYYDFDVNVLNVQNLNTIRFTVSFNASTLQFLNVTPQSFFPASPASSFQYQADISSGMLKVNMSLAKSQSPLSGNGILVRVFFKINQKPTSSIVSPITFTQVTLLDSSAKPIASDSVGGICFWKSIGPDPLGQGLIKEYTDRGGGSYRLGETVVLSANVTFAGYPVANKLVAFQVLNPANATIVIDVATTNTSGIATISFGLPDIYSNVGPWTAFANVELDQVTYSDVINFQVAPVLTVGGYSFVVKAPGNPVNPVEPYTLVFLTMILGFVFCKPRRRKQQ